MLQFFYSSGERDGVSKIVFLITDGNQNPKQSRDGKVQYDPVVASQPMVDRGMSEFFKTCLLKTHILEGLDYVLGYS